MLLRRANPPYDMGGQNLSPGLAGGLSLDSPYLPGGGGTANGADSDSGATADASLPVTPAAPPSTPTNQFDFGSLGEFRGESTVPDTSMRPSTTQPGHKVQPPKVVTSRPHGVGPARAFITPPTEEEWERQRRVDALNEEVARRRAASEAQQAALAMARDERDQWRAASNHLEAKAQVNRRVWWGLGAAVGVGALNYFRSSRKGES